MTRIILPLSDMIEQAAVQVLSLNFSSAGSIMHGQSPWQTHALQVSCVQNGLHTLRGSKYLGAISGAWLPVGDITMPQ